MNLQPIPMDMIHTKDCGNHHIQHTDLKGHVAYLKKCMKLGLIGIITFL